MRRTRGRAAGDHAQNQGGLTWRSHTRPYGGLSAYNACVRSALTGEGGISGEPDDTERVQSGSEGGRWKSTHWGNSLAAYPTSEDGRAVYTGTEETKKPKGEGKQVSSLSLSRLCYDAPLTSRYSDRRHHPWPVYGLLTCSPAPPNFWI